MKICVVGAGHVGLVTAAGFAEMGHRVICMDQDRKKLSQLRKGKPWFYEPGLEELLAKNLRKKRLSFTDKVAEGVRKSEILFIAVGTPPLPSGDADLTAVEQVVRQIAHAADGYRLIVEKSTVPVETGRRIKQALEIMPKRRAPVEVASNPEFLREGSAVHDFFHPDRVVIGVESARARGLLEELYKPFKAPLVVTDIASAELIKHSSNAYLSMKISFINAVSVICGKVGADVELVARGVGLDSRIGASFLKAGIGYGGFCLDGSQTVLVETGRHELRRLPLRDLGGFMEQEGRPVKVFSIDPSTYRATFAPITAVTCRRFEGRLLTVRTRMNKRVRVTEDHPMLVHEGGKLITRLAVDLKLGDLLPSFLSYPRGSRQTHIDLLDALQRVSPELRRSMRIRLPAATFQEHEPVIRRALAQSPRRAKVDWRDTSRSRCLDLQTYLSAEDRLPPGSRGSARLFTSKGHTTEVPAVWALDESLCRFLGYYAAEGHIHHERCLRGVRSRVVLHFHEDEEQDLRCVTDFLESKDIRYDRRAVPQFHTVRLTISSRILAFLLEEVLGCGLNSYDAAVPDVVFGLNAACREAFLTGIYRGDGSVCFPTHSPAVTYDFGTVSRTLAQGVSLLCHSLGIVPGTKVSRSAKSTMDAHFVRISGRGQVQRFSWASDPELQGRVHQRLSQYRRRIRPTGYRVMKGKEGKIGLTRIVRIDAETVTQDVYCIEVEGTRTFVTDDGIVVHNCFPKDLEAYIRIAEKMGYDFKLLKAVRQINDEQRKTLVEKVGQLLWNLKDKKIGLLGLSFKPDTDDLRFAPSLEIIAALEKTGARIHAYDPQAMPEAKRLLGQKVQLAKNPYALAREADCLVLVTEWQEFKDLDFDRIKKLMRQPVLVDGRNLYDPAKMRKLGFRYTAMGRGKED